MDWRRRLFCISAAYCQMFEREELGKLLFQLCSHKDREAYMIKKAAGYGRKNGQKFLINSPLICCGFEPLMYYYFWIIP